MLVQHHPKAYRVQLRFSAWPAVYTTGHQGVMTSAKIIESQAKDYPDAPFQLSLKIHASNAIMSER
jgi:DNA-binding NtrC family response regulator